MKTYLYAASAVLALFSLSAGPASAEMSAMAPARVNFCGTVVKLTEGHCIGVKGSMVGAPLAEITSARPRPTVGKLIAGSGMPGGVSTCMEGTHLTAVTWRKVAVCPLAH
jgi:hypothetical protein